MVGAPERDVEPGIPNREPGHTGCPTKVPIGAAGPFKSARGSPISVARSLVPIYGMLAEIDHKHRNHSCYALLSRVRKLTIPKVEVG
jgi:hypothetical protein